MQYVEALPALQAQDALDHIAQHAAGAGAMEEKAQRRFLGGLRRAANQGQPVEKASAASLAAMGIRVETVPARDE